MKMRNHLGPLLALPLFVLAVPALAHGLLVSVEAQAGRIDGRVYYSDGAPGAGEYVELKRSAEAREPIASAITDVDGRFSFSTQGGPHVIVAHGEEGHLTEISVEDGERGRLIERDEAEQVDDGAGLPPAWLLIGALLALSMIRAVWFKASFAEAAKSRTGD